MPLRSDWDQETETPQLLEQALVDRYQTANQLMTSGEWDAAIYFFGYVVELVLKTAYFRFLGNNVAASVRNLLPPARARGRLLLVPNIDDDTYHSLLFWSELLRAERQEQDQQARQARQTPPPAPLYDDAVFVQHCRTVHDNWTVKMRYHPNRATEADANQVAAAAKWLFDNRVDLGV